MNSSDSINYTHWSIMHFGPNCISNGQILQIFYPCRILLSHVLVTWKVQLPYITQIKKKNDTSEKSLKYPRSLQSQDGRC